MDSFKHHRQKRAEEAEIIVRSQHLLAEMRTRRSVRSFSIAPIPLEVVINCVSIAASAPSGANQQPWSFVLVRDPDAKKRIREKAEAIEKVFYTKKATQKWRSTIQPLKTDHTKPFLEQAPYLICIFVQGYSTGEEGDKSPHYYASEAVGIATGFLISSLHQLGISTLPYTPAPMSFLRDLLHRPKNERPYMILAVGYRNDEYVPPQLEKKKRGEYLTII
jgi:iodotyrosine deiodinase